MPIDDTIPFPRERRPLAAIGVLVLAAAGLIWGGLVYVRDLETSFRTEVGHQLSAVAELKATQISAITNEWRRDASLFLGNPGTDPILREGLNQTANRAAHERASELLTRTRAAHDYESVMLIDATGTVRASASRVTRGLPDVFGLLPDVKLTLTSRKIRFGDLYQDPSTGEIRAAMLIPVLAEREQDPPQGVLVLLQDPAQTLYPLVAQWPTTSETAEIVIGRQDGGQALILNPLRFRPDAALHLRIPLDRAQVPIVRAIKGVRGLVEGTDYHGELSIADVRDVPGTPWFMVSRIDQREALAPLQQSLRSATALALTLLLALALIAAWVWRNFQANVLRENFRSAKAAAELTRSTRLNAAAFNAIPEALVVTDLGARIESVNAAFTKISGYCEAEALGKTPRLLRAPDQDPAIYAAMRAQLAATGAWRGELLNQRKSGEVYPVSLSISTVRDESGKPTNYVGVSTDISQQRSAEAAIDQLSRFDALTGLPNRAQMLTRVEAACVQAARDQRRFAVFAIKLGRLQEVYASQDYRAADEVVRELSERLRLRVRATDLLARIGASDYMLLVNSVEQEADVAVIARDLTDILTAEISLTDGRHIALTASTGISLYPQDGQTPVDLARNAEAARQRARGSDQDFSFYDSNANASAMARISMEVDLRRALAQQEFVLHYQPKVSLRTGEICGVEALIRWQREDGTLVPPLEFIPVAERTKLILPIGQWVIREACRQIRQWLDEGLPEVRVAVNVSAHQVRATDLDALLSQALAEYRVAPHCLEVELTESVLMEDAEKAATLLARVKATGVDLALDDFGTGYSSLAYLSRFPFDVMKIDRSFVQAMVTEPGAATIAMTIIDLAHRMRMKVVAEGVETEAQLGFLRKNGCDQMQGYLFSRALTAPALTALLREGTRLALDAEANSSQKTLLLVDDEPSILSSLRRLLRNEGYQILTAQSGAEALELMARHDVHVVMTDQRMPHMSGTELLHRACVIAPDTVRLILSGYTDLETVTRAVNEGDIYKFMTKPWDDDQLRAVIQDAFRYSQAVVPARRTPLAQAAEP